MGPNSSAALLLWPLHGYRCYSYGRTASNLSPLQSAILRRRRPIRGQPQAAHFLNKLSAEYMVKEKERKAKAVSGKKRPLPEEAPDHEEEDSGSSPSPWEDSDDGDM